MLVGLWLLVWLRLVRPWLLVGLWLLVRPWLLVRLRLVWLRLLVGLWLLVRAWLLVCLWLLVGLCLVRPWLLVRLRLLIGLRLLVRRLLVCIGLPVLLVLLICQLLPLPLMFAAVHSNLKELQDNGPANTAKRAQEYVGHIDVAPDNECLGKFCETSERTAENPRYENCLQSGKLWANAREQLCKKQPQRQKESCFLYDVDCAAKASRCEVLLKGHEVALVSDLLKHGSELGFKLKR